MDTSIPLVPQPKVWLRIAILALLVALAWIGESTWYAKFIFCLAMTGLFGTFPRARINPEYLEQRWFVAFLPMHGRRMRLEKVIQIETDLEERLGTEVGVVLSFFIGVWNVLMIWFTDRLVPWFGGDYKLWLRTKSDRRVLVWQGNGERNFRKNVEILKDVTGLPILRG